MMEKKRESAQLPYSRNDILRCLQSIQEGQALISYYADMHNVSLIEVYYEKSLENPDREIKRIAQFLGAQHLFGTTVEPAAISIDKQGNEDNLRLSERFKQEFFRKVESGG